MKVFEFDDAHNVFNETTLDESEVDELSRVICAQRHNVVIGLQIEKSALLIFLCKKILESGNAFAFVQPGLPDQLARRRCVQLQIDVLISTIKPKWICSSRVGSFYLSLLPYFDGFKRYGERILFSIQTSGSTGEPKTVMVPEACIQPNVNYFIDRHYSEQFGVNATSRLLWSTGLNFDPGILEMLIGIQTNCNVFVVKDHQRVCIPTLSKMVEMVKPVFWQITPAVLNMCCESFLERIFGSVSFTEHILVGGDTFPVQLVQRFAKDNRARIWNLYGVTEVSCWASCTEFNPIEDTVADASNAIPGTELDFDLSNGVQIRGSRSCFVLGGSTLKSVTSTNDQFVQVSEGGRDKFMVVSREKINGVVITRDVEDFLLNEYKQVTNCRLVTNKGQLYVFVVLSNASEHGHSITVPKEFNIRKVIVVEELPITENGKINDIGLRSLVEQEEKSGLMTGELACFLKSHTSLRKKEIPLWTMGFSSKALLEFAFELETNGCGTDYDLKKVLFEPTTSLDDLFEFMRGQEKDICVAGSIPESALNARVQWVGQMEKCVDAGPVGHQKVLVAVDMSGLIVCFESDHGTILWSAKESAPIKVAPFVGNEFVVYGCTQGNVFVRKVGNGELVFTANVEASIGSSPQWFGPDQVSFGCYGKTLFSMDMHPTELHEVYTIPDQRIKNPAWVGSNSVIITTVEGVVMGLQKRDNANLKRRWKRNLNDTIFLPVMSSPWDSSHAIVFTLSGQVNVISSEQGALIQRFDLSHSIAYEPVIVPNGNVMALVVFTGPNKVVTLTCETDWKRMDQTFDGVRWISGGVYCSRLKLIMVKSERLGLCDILGYNPFNATLESVASLDSPSFGNVALDESSQEVLMFVGNRANTVSCYNISCTNTT